MPRKAVAMDQFKSPEHLRNKAFFEAYFSNFIEGTIFEAEEIIFSNKIPVDRPRDGHDILGTFKIVSDPDGMRRVPRTFSEFESLLKERHYTLMQARPEVRPGDYKLKPNRAGNSRKRV